MLAFAQLTLAVLAVLAGSTHAQSAVASVATRQHGAIALVSGSHVPPITYNNTRMVCLINQERARAGVAPVGIDARLTGVAGDQSTYQAQIGRMTNEGPNGESYQDMVDDSGYVWVRIAENVGWMTTRFADEKGMFDVWMRDDRTRGLLMSGDYIDVGTGGVSGNNGATYFTALVARERGRDTPSNVPAC